MKRLVIADKSQPRVDRALADAEQRVGVGQPGYQRRATRLPKRNIIERGIEARKGTFTMTVLHFHPQADRPPWAISACQMPSLVFRC